MNEELPSTKTIIKRSAILLCVFIAFVGIAFSAKHYNNYVSWKNRFELSYVGTVQNYEGEAYGREYRIQNKTNNTYEIQTIYIKVEDAHDTYTIPYDVYITLRPHEEEIQKFSYSKIGEYFGKEFHSCDFVIKGIEYEKR